MDDSARADPRTTITLAELQAALCALERADGSVTVREVELHFHLRIESATAILQLDDPEHFNTFSTALGEDMRSAVQHICTLACIDGVVLQGKGPHFSVGGNPYATRGSPIMTPLSLHELYAGFLQLRALPQPVTAAVHGTLVGGGVAGGLHADYIAAERASAFEHGNLVRGVCVLGMLSQTFAIALGQHAQHVYLQNARLSAATAHAAGLVQQLCMGVNTTQVHAREMAARVLDKKNLANSIKGYRAAIDAAAVVREAVGHAECQKANGGFAKSAVETHNSMVDSSLNLRSVLDDGVRTWQASRDASVH